MIRLKAFVSHTEDLEEQYCHISLYKEQRSRIEVEEQEFQVGTVSTE